MMADTMFCLAWICGFDVDWYDLNKRKGSDGDGRTSTGDNEGFSWRSGTGSRYGNFFPLEGVLLSIE